MNGMPISTMDAGAMEQTVPDSHSSAMKRKRKILRDK